MKTFNFALFGLLALVNAEPQFTAPRSIFVKRLEGIAAGELLRRPGPPPQPQRHQNTKDKREANPEAWDLQEEDVYGEPRRAHAGIYPEPEEPLKHENTKDKREAHAGAYPELTDAVIGAKETLSASVSVDEGFEILKKEIVERYGVREKREEQRYQDYQIAASDNLDYDMDMDEPPSSYRHENTKDKREAIPDGAHEAEARPFKLAEDVLTKLTKLTKRSAEAHPFKLAEDVLTKLTKRSAEARPFKLAEDVITKKSAEDESLQDLYSSSDPYSQDPYYSSEELNAEHRYQSGNTRARRDAKPPAIAPGAPVVHAYDGPQAPIWAPLLVGK